MIESGTMEPITLNDQSNDCNKDDIIIIGVDEAGRGPLFGDVYVSAVVFNKHVKDNEDYDLSILKDSKKYTSKKKIEEAFEFVKKISDIYSIKYANVEEIDKYNILQATQRKMHQAIHEVLQKLIQQAIDQKSFDDNFFTKIKIVVDGNYFNTFKYFHHDSFKIISHKCLVKGDSLCKEISAASILAKVSRDRYILDFVQANPEYEERYKLSKNKGYGTKDHINGIKSFGYSPFHRKTFKLKK